MTFKASLDKLAIGITLGVIILFAAIILGQHWFITDFGNAGQLFTISTMLIILLIAYIFSPLGYTINKNEIIIKRPISVKKIARNDIVNVEVIDKEKIVWSLRTFGVGGLFGYYGKFYNSDFGHMTWYLTRRDKLVLIKTISEKKIVISPNEPERFVETFNNQTVL